MPANHHPEGWSDERVAKLKKLWGDGHSCSQIARQLGGVTRNAVIGKISRLGLSHPRAAKPERLPRPAHQVDRSPRGTAVRPPRNYQLAALVPQRAAAAALPLGPVAGSTDGKGLLELHLDECRWPLAGSEGEGQRYCACATPRGRPYCLNHAEVARSPKQPATSLARDLRRYI
jgi:GcrA cell cycle regulator